MFVKEKTLFQTTKYATTKSLHWFDDGHPIIKFIYFYKTTCFPFR
jgi:hypothetical protein